MGLHREARCNREKEGCHRSGAAGAHMIHFGSVTAVNRGHYTTVASRVHSSAAAERPEFLGFPGSISRSALGPRGTTTWSIAVDSDVNLLD